MPAFPAETPPDGLNVDIVLLGGATFVAYWYTDQWWTGVNNNPFDIPVDNGHVVSWELIA